MSSRATPKTVAIGDVIEVTTEKPGHGGFMVARLDGRVCFVFGALPDERVRAEIFGVAATFCRARVLEVLQPHPSRIDSLCAAAARGAGCCDYAFVEPEYARSLKAEVAGELMERFGGGVPEQWDGTVRAMGGLATHYRTRIKLGFGADGVPGISRPRSNDLVEGMACAQWMPGLEMVLDARHTPRRSDRGPRRRGERRIDPYIAGAVGSDGHVSAAIVDGDRVDVFTGGQVVTENVNGVEFRLDVRGFWQAHKEAAATYAAVVTDWAGFEPETVWDLYSGVGVLSSGFTTHTRVWAVESSREATREGARAFGDRPHVAVHRGDVEKAIANAPAVVAHPNVVILDPPRAGAGRRVVSAIEQSTASTVIHIGCDAASFARDVGLYRDAGFELDRMVVFDAFPLTHHTESIARLRRM